jgi:hypothetical protein
MMNHTSHPQEEAPEPLGGVRGQFLSNTQRMLPNGAGFHLVTTEGSEWCILHKAKCNKELQEKYGCGSASTDPPGGSDSPGDF